MKPDPGETAGDWLSRFHRADKATFDALYREHFITVDAAVARTLRGADRETVVHEVFYHLMTNAEARHGFHGGSLAAWLTTLARNKAIDFLRRQRREEPTGTDPEDFGAAPDSQRFELKAEARLLLEQLRRTVVPPKWRSVFDARFLQELDQPQAAKALGISRTTLAYREYRIRAMMRRFVLADR
jgi:RNA polymerase sigma-70 factor (ECF subfamily)